MNKQERLLKTVTFVDAQVFNDVQTTYTSSSFRCASYDQLLLLVNLDEDGSPDDIVIDVEYSDENVTFYKLMNGPFGDLRWEDTACPNLEAIETIIKAHYIRITVTATGTTAQKTFTLTVKAEFSR